MRPPAGGDGRVGDVGEEQLRFATKSFCFFNNANFCPSYVSYAIKMNKTGLPSLTASPPESESTMWEDAGLPHFAGLFFGIIFLVVLLTYVAKNFQQKAPKTSTISELDRWLQKIASLGKFYQITTLYLFKPKLDTFWVWFWNPPKSLDSPQCNN